MRSGQKLTLKKSRNIIAWCFVGLILASPQITSSQESSGLSKSKFDSQTIFTKPFEECWHVNHMPALSAVASDNVSSLYEVVNDRFLSYEIVTGRKQWETSLGGEPAGVPYIESRNIFIASQTQFDETVQLSNNVHGEQSIIIRSLNKSSGLINWATKVPVDGELPGKVFLYVVKNDLMVIGASGDVYGLVKTDGKLTRRKKLSNALIAGPLFVNNGLVWAAADRQVFYSPLSDDPASTANKIADGFTPGAAFYDIQNRNLLLGDKKGAIALYNPVRGAGVSKVVWRRREGGGITNIAATGKGFLFSSEDNFIRLVSKAKGGLIWKKRLPSRISVNPVIADGYVLISAIGEASVFILESETGEIVNKIVLPNVDEVITGLMRIEDVLIVSALGGVYAFSPGGCSSANE